MTRKPSVRSVQPAQLRSLFRNLTRTLLASGCVAGCSNEPELLSSGWEPITCNEGRPRFELSDFAPARPFEYLGFYRFSWGEQGRPGTGDWLESHHVGAACSGVSDQAACEAQVAALMPDGSCQETGSCFPALLVRTGEGLARLDTTEELVALFGAIDTSVEAMVLAHFSLSFMLSCPYQNSDAPKLRGTEFRERDEGYQLQTHWGNCTTGTMIDTLTVDAAGNLSRQARDMLTPITCIAGRRPHGLCAVRPAAARSALGDFFAQAANLEAASVFAFLQLARELTQLDAPRALIESCLQAVDEELRHTRDMAALARRFGGTPQRPVLEPAGVRSRFEIARENAVEGCVRETYGALLATYQAESARDPLVRRTLQSIALDETRHARLSWELASWLEPQLAEAEQSALEACRDHAVAELRRELQGGGLESTDRLTIGLPDAQMAERMLDRLADTLWS